MDLEIPFSFIDIFINENGISRSISDLRAVYKYGKKYQANQFYSVHFIYIITLIYTIIRYLTLPIQTKYRESKWNINEPDIISKSSLQSLRFQSIFNLCETQFIYLFTISSEIENRVQLFAYNV